MLIFARIIQVASEGLNLDSSASGYVREGIVEITVHLEFNFNFVIIQKV